MQFNWEKIGIRTRVDKNRLYIFDPFRKKFVVATPEEEVRQYILFELVTNLKYPPSQIAVERQIQYGKRKKRFDILAFKNGKPFLLIECKAPNIALNQLVFNQLGQYNHVLKVPFLAITNGSSVLCSTYNQEKESFEFKDMLPPYVGEGN